MQMYAKIAKSKIYPQYVIDKGYSLFPKETTSEWCLKSLANLFTKYLINPEEKLNMPGIDNVELFIGEAGSLTGWHEEDLNFASVNYLVSGKPKFWVVVSYKNENQLKKIVQEKLPRTHRKKYPEQYHDTRSADLHKTMVLLPQHLLAANTPFRTKKQLPDDYVITLRADFHFVVNSGSNIAEATNFVFNNWETHRKTFPTCDCGHRENIMEIAKRFNI